MGENRNFEPYFDWAGITDEMTDDLHERILEYKKAQEDFIAEKSNQNAARFMRLQWEVARIGNAITQTIYTIPVMVHVAGQKIYGKDEDGTDQVIQRCKRCGSILQGWQDRYQVATPEGVVRITEENIPWWQENDVVAKPAEEIGTKMYEIENDRPLEEHEKLCPDLSGLR